MILMVEEAEQQQLVAKTITKKPRESKPDLRVFESFEHKYNNLF